MADRINPYLHLSRRELAEVIFRVRGRLTAPGQKSAVDRRQLADDVSDVLGAMLNYMRIPPHSHPLNRVEQFRATLEQAYMERYWIEERNLRTMFLREAAEFVFGDGPSAQGWLTYGRLEGGESSPHTISMEGASGLESSLRALDRAREGK